MYARHTIWAGRVESQGVWLCSGSRSVLSHRLEREVALRSDLEPIAPQSFV